MTDAVCTVTDALDRRTTCLDFSVYQYSTDSDLFWNVICSFVFVQDLRFPVLNFISFSRILPSWSAHDTLSRGLNASKPVYDTCSVR